MLAAAPERGLPALRRAFHGLRPRPGTRPLHRLDASGVVAHVGVEHVEPAVVLDELPALLRSHAGVGADGEASHIAPAAAYSFSLTFERPRLKRESTSGAIPMSNSLSAAIRSVKGTLRRLR